MDVEPFVAVHHSGNVAIPQEHRVSRVWTGWVKDQNLVKCWGVFNYEPILDDVPRRVAAGTIGDCRLKFGFDWIRHDCA
jgi:hypothetical protein